MDEKQKCRNEFLLLASICQEANPGHWPRVYQIHDDPLFGEGYMYLEHGVHSDSAPLLTRHQIGGMSFSGANDFATALNTAVALLIGEIEET